MFSSFCPFWSKTTMPLYANTFLIPFESETHFFISNNVPYYIGESFVVFIHFLPHLQSFSFSDQFGNITSEYWYDIIILGLRPHERPYSFETVYFFIRLDLPSTRPASESAHQNRIFLKPLSSGFFLFGLAEFVWTFAGYFLSQLRHKLRCSLSSSKWRPTMQPCWHLSPVLLHVLTSIFLF